LSGVSFAVIYAFSALLLARWADRGNRRTLMTVTLTGWSLMTAVGAWVTSFWQLALARFGVGVFEPGAIPTGQSLVCDYFPPDRRATAVTVLTGGGTAFGWLVGIGLGGYIAATHGWRAAFLIAGLPGIALALLVRCAIPEPRSKLGFPRAAGREEGFVQAVGRLRGKRSYVWLLTAQVFYCIFAYGIWAFAPSFIVRSFDTTLDRVSLPWGAVIASANILGAFIGGMIANRLSARDLRWLTWMPALAIAFALPVYCVAFQATHLWTFVAVQFVAELILAAGFPVNAVAMMAICGSARRSTAVAFTLSLSVLIGASLGPFLSGAISDLFNPTAGIESLRRALTAMCFFLIPASGMFVLAGRFMRQDLEP
jgi:MFS family permease